jgi:hypothetical protein
MTQDAPSLKYKHAIQMQRTYYKNIAQKLRETFRRKGEQCWHTGIEIVDLLEAATCAITTETNNTHIHKCDPTDSLSDTQSLMWIIHKITNSKKIWMMFCTGIEIVDLLEAAPRPIPAKDIQPLAD